MTKLSIFALSALLVGSAAQYVGQGDDGNPHNWDRKRRCDHVHYSPVCGPCEGIGGLVTGDDNSAITIAACEVVGGLNDVDPATLVRPVWAREWTTRSYEILIGPKTDPFCFSTIPSNSSAGALCYRPQTGVQYYDFEDKRALRLDVNVKTPVGNVTSSVYHQGRNFWIVNKLPWYALGIEQCICTHAREGGVGSLGIFPLATTWTDNLSFVAREKISVEYDQGTHVMDHWAFGPHHVWTFPDTGRILRMWQPFNGLQVFPDGTGTSNVDKSKFSELPPAKCKKQGGALQRIKCADSGYADDVVPTPVAEDLVRAQTKVPRPEYRGNSFPHMSSTLNTVLQRNELIKTRPCNEWSIEELQALQSQLYVMKDHTFDTIYHGAKDRRRMNTNIVDLQVQWEAVGKLIESSDYADTAADVLRDGHCHETVMWYVHHLTQDVKEALGAGENKIEIPLLSENDHQDQQHGACSEAKAFVDVTGALAMACQLHEDKVSCASCHSDAP